MTRKIKIVRSISKGMFRIEGENPIEISSLDLNKLKLLMPSVFWVVIYSPEYETNEDDSNLTKRTFPFGGININGSWIPVCEGEYYLARGESSREMVAALFPIWDEIVESDS